MMNWTRYRRRKSEFKFALQLSLWQPLQDIIEKSHILPPVAALAVFSLLASDGQIREIYLSYIEELTIPGLSPQTLVPIAIAVAGLALISALLFEAHYWLTPPVERRNCFAALSDPDAGSNVVALHRTAAIAYALAPWLGVTVGILRTQLYLANSLRLLPLASLDDATQPPRINANLPTPGLWTIAATAFILGVAIAYFVYRRRDNSVLRSTVVIVTPAAAICMLALLVNYFPTDVGKPLMLATFAGVALLTIAYYYCYRELDAMPNAWPLCVWLIFPWAAIAIFFAFTALFQHPHRSNPWSIIPIAMSMTTIVGMIVAATLDRYLESAKLQIAILGGIILLAVAATCISYFAPYALVPLYRIIGPLGTMEFSLLFLIAIFTLLAFLSERSKFPAFTLVVLFIVGIVLLPIPIDWTVYLVLAMCLVLGFLAWAAERNALVGVVIILFALAAIIRGEARRVENAPLNLRLPVDGSDKQRTDENANNDVCQHFQRWLKAKTEFQDRSVDVAPCRSSTAANDPRTQATAAAALPPRYTAFIIADEGGGIYAATAASMFLAKMQSKIPDFSDHVFAISAVSGGAIGAAVFAALAPTSAPLTQKPANIDSSSSSAAIAQSSSSDCPGQISPNAGPKQPLLDEVSQVMRDDHFSPVVGSIFPELLGSSTGRAEALAASFASSVSFQDCVAGESIIAPFIDYWNKTRHMPALVLNATWVETGSRAAFAPFLLNNIDSSLYSFTDLVSLDKLDSRSPPKSGAGPHPISLSLIDAAVVSARFPAILPPYSLDIDTSLTAKVQNAPRTRLRWNFVDGGYADFSGATTALAIYQALKGIADNNGVDLKLILITSVEPQPDLISITGTPFRDTLAPIDAVLKVREGLGYAAVARACNSIYPESTKSCLEHAGDAKANLQIIQVEDQIYALPLGWKLSRTTFDLIRWMMGSIESDPARIAALCVKSNETIERSVMVKASQMRNSCVLSSLVQSLKEEEVSH
jgi:hypothetical protein